MRGNQKTVVYGWTLGLKTDLVAAKTKMASLTDIGQPRASIQRFNWLEAFEFSVSNFNLL